MRHVRPEDVRVTMIDGDLLFVDALVHHCASLADPVGIDHLDPLDPGLWLRLAAAQPDVVTLDPDQVSDPVEAVMRVVALTPRSHLLVLTLSRSATMLAQLAETGVAGWVGKGEPVVAFVDAVHVLCRGGTRFPSGHSRVRPPVRSPASCSHLPARRDLTGGATRSK